MSSSMTPNHLLFAEPVQITLRTHRRQESDRSDVSPSPSPSNDSDSTSSSMAANTRRRFLAEPFEYSSRVRSKMEVEHIEKPSNTDVEMSDAGHSINGFEETSEVAAQNSAEGESKDTTQHKPKRKFAVEPIEASNRSSRKHEQETDNTAPPKRRFAPEPINTSARSSRSKENNHEEDKATKPRRKFAVEPVETTTKSSKDRDDKAKESESGTKPRRRFAPQLVEEDTQSKDDQNKDKSKDAGNGNKTRRRFAPQLIEEDSHGSKNDQMEEKSTSKPRRKFAVEPMETSTSSSRQKRDDSGGSPSRKSSGGRRFSPDLVGTAKASFRKKDKTESAVPKWLRAETVDGSWSAPEAEESRFSAKNLARKARRDPRRHSYNVPDLPMIQSDSSGEESADQEFPDPPHHSHVHREKFVPGGGMSYKEYLLSLSHEAAMKTLREQAVAAYGDQEDHVPFGHFGGDSEDEDYSMHVGQLSIKDDADPHFFRRMSQDDLHLKLEDERVRHAQFEEAKKNFEEDTCGVSRFSATALATRHHLGIHHPDSYKTKQEKTKAQDSDDEYTKMKSAAKPPMLGYDITFPYSVSPRMTRCDPDQAPRPRRADSGDGEERNVGSPELWSAKITIHQEPSTTLWGGMGQASGGTGLWGGLCQASNTTVPTTPTTPLRSGIQTPMHEAKNPFDSPRPRTPGTKTPKRATAGLWGSTTNLPLTPPRTKQDKPVDQFASTLNQKLVLEAQIDAEFPPRVITQIYNYLSLGYPAIARDFDEELSKIARVSIIDLRRDDRSETGTLKGHIGAPEGEGDHTEDEDGRIRGCRRWEALRVYVREWARQSPNFATERIVPYATMGTGMWGNNAPVRKGSWGW